jgi:hypothetical protein
VFKLFDSNLQRVEETKVVEHGYNGHTAAWMSAFVGPFPSVCRDTSFVWQMCVVCKQVIWKFGIEKEEKN